MIKHKKKEFYKFYYFEDDPPVPPTRLNIVSVVSTASHFAHDWTIIGIAPS